MPRLPLGEVPPRAAEGLAFNLLPPASWAQNNPPAPPGQPPFQGGLKNTLLRFRLPCRERCHQRRRRGLLLTCSTPPSPSGAAPLSGGPEKHASSLSPPLQGEVPPKAAEGEGSPGDFRSSARRHNLRTPTGDRRRVGRLCRSKAMDCLVEALTGKCQTGASYEKHSPSLPSPSFGEPSGSVSSTPVALSSAN